MKGAPLKEVFGMTIRKLREDQKLSQQEVADYSEMDRTYLSDLERGLYYPSLLIVYKLSEVLKIKPHELIEKIDRQLKI